MYAIQANEHGLCQQTVYDRMKLIQYFIQTLLWLYVYTLQLYNMFHNYGRWSKPYITTTV